MDNVTHGLAGLLMADATISAVARKTGAEVSGAFRRRAILIGVIAAELPDADLVYSREVLGIGKLGYLLHHRGHTHTFLFAIVAAFLIWAIAIWLSRRSGSRKDSRVSATSVEQLTTDLESKALLLLALAGTCSHVLLDFTNNYGVHPFWPVDNRWFYGDAVFIIEPWLWVISVPALLFGPRRLPGRLVLGFLLLAILAASWRMDIVPHDVALVLSIGALIWILTISFVSSHRRLVLAAGAWMLVTVTGFAASSAAQQTIASAMSDTELLDAVLTPDPGNPLCIRAFAIELDGPLYRVTTATVAAFPQLRSAITCAGGDNELEASDVARPGLGEGSQASARAGTSAIQWHHEWSRPHAELVELSTSRCDVAAALEFVRVPVWKRLADGAIRVSDVRFGAAGTGFAEIVFDSNPEKCPRFVPGWIPPRADLLSRN